MSTGQILTLSEVAERLRCSVSTVRLHIDSGRLSAINLGTARHRHYRVSERALADFIDSEPQPISVVARVKDPGIVSKRLMRRLG